jgi:hypothetical protein
VGPPPLLPVRRDSLAISIDAISATGGCDKRRFLFCPLCQQRHRLSGQPGPVRGSEIHLRLGRRRPVGDRHLTGRWWRRSPPRWWRQPCAVRALCSGAALLHCSAIYWNPNEDLVIRQRADSNEDDDLYIVICTNDIAEFVDRLTNMIRITRVERSPKLKSIHF